MTKICSSKGPRYPVYNDKKGWSENHWWYGTNFAGPDYFPAPTVINPILPRPTVRPQYNINQPKAASGFLRGQRRILK